MPNILKTSYWTLREKLRGQMRDKLVDPIRTCTVRGKKIRIGSCNAIEDFRIGSYETKEPETLDWIERTVKPGDCFFDIGANIGLYSIYASVCCPSAKIFSFEVEAKNFSRMFRNIVNNNLHNVTPINVALIDGTRFDYLFLSDMTTGSALHSVGTGVRSDLKQGVMGVSLDELVLKWGLPQPTLLKIDVDGNEEGIIQGARHVLESSLCREVLIELTEGTQMTMSINKSLLEMGFQMVQQSQWHYDSSEGKIKNFIYKKNDHHP